MARIGLLLAHEHGFLRAALRVFLDAQPDMRVLGEAGDARELLQKAREKKPEVVLIDSGLPGVAGTKAIVQTLRVCPRARVLVLTVHDDPASARSALTAGASGLVVKRSTELELLSAIRAVHRGQAFVDARIAARLGRRAAPACRPRPPLSTREQQVLGLLSRGHTNREIAGSLRVSVKTVETYKARLRDKLGLLRRADFVQYGLETGLLAPAGPAAEE